MDAATTSTAPEKSTKPERIDFLKQVVAFSEGNIRSYDTKAQISLAAFVLSANPLVAISNSACSQSGAKTVLMILVPAYFAAIVAYLWVLWPVAPPIAELTKGITSQNIFYVHNPVKLGGMNYVERLGNLSIENELTVEALKLAHIRRVKASRFKTSLFFTLATYIVIAAAFFLIGQCF